MLFSYNFFKRETEEANPDDEDHEDEQTIADNLEQVQADILETEEIRLSNIMKQMADNMHSSCILVYSREVPTVQMEVVGIPFKKSRNENETQWLRFEIYQLSNAVRIDVVSSDPSLFNFFYSVTIDQPTYSRIQREQSIKVAHSDFALRVATLLDYCLV